MRAGCTLTAYSDSSFNGNAVELAAGLQDRWGGLCVVLCSCCRGNSRWVVLADHAQYRHMDNDIESLRCVCTL